MSEKMLMLTMTRIEVEHLEDLVRQFADLVNGTPSDDPAVERLAPDVYPDDPDASSEFRSLTRGDLLHRRARDASMVRRALEKVTDSSETDEFAPVDLPLDEEATEAWLRTLTALRLVIASRLGISAETQHDPEDPRFAVFDWLGYRLDGLVAAADEAHGA